MSVGAVNGPAESGKAAREGRPRSGRAPRLSRAPARYRVDPRLSFLAACLYPGSIVAPATFVVLTGALTIPRIFLFLAAIATARELWHKLTTGGFVPIATDILVPLMTAWMLTALYIHDGAKAFIGYGAVAALEFSFAYFTARVFFGTPAGFAQFVRVMCIVSILVLLTALIDTLSGRNLIAQLGWQLSGTMPTEVLLPMRFGLIRAQGSLEHPILLGTFFVICMIIFFHSAMRPTEKLTWILPCIVGALLPLSSAPLLSLVMVIGIVVFLRIFDRLPWRMVVFCATAAFALCAFFVFVDNPLTTLIQNLTYDPQTGMFRVMIWQWAGLNIRRSPWIGIGFADWLRADDMPPSIDSLYLVQTIRHGIPALVLLGLSILSTGVTMPFRPQHRYPTPFIARIRVAMAIAIFIYSFNAFTVHFWGSSWNMLAIVLGIRAGFTESIFLHPSARGDAPVPAKPPAGVPRASSRRGDPRRSGAG